MEQVEIIHTNKQVVVNESNIDGSTFTMSSLQHLYFNDVNLANTKIINANLSDLEIEGAQLGGAFIHNVGPPPEGHPMYRADNKHRPLRFEDCNLNRSSISDCNLKHSSITNCNLSGVTISDCNLDGMTINGIEVTELLKNYRK